MDYPSIGFSICASGQCGHTEILVKVFCFLVCLIEVLEQRYYSCFPTEAALKQSDKITLSVGSQPLSVTIVH